MINIFNLTNYKLDIDYIDNVHKHYIYNKRIGEYYIRFGNEEKNDKLIRKGENVLNCQKFWRIRNYKKINVKEVEKVTLCHDKFCNNCKKVIQSARSMKFLPVLEKHEDYLYHLTLTVPSCTVPDLKKVINKLNKSFSILCKYLSLRLKSDINKNGVFFRNFNFIRYDFKGALRSLEVTWFKNQFGEIMYHPHLHCCMVFEDFSIDTKNQEVVPYSYKRNDDKIYPFSQDDIFFQRIWYLIYNDISITKKNVEDLWRVRKKLNDGILGKFKNVGYSCNLSKFDKGEYAELFKYMVKECDYENNILSYSTFKALYFALKGVRQLQGYGCLYNILDGDYDEELKLVEEELDEYLSNYTSFVHYEKINLVRSNIKSGQLYISKKKIFSYLISLHKQNVKKDGLSGKEKYRQTVLEFTDTVKKMRSDINKNK